MRATLLLLSTLLVPILLPAAPAEPARPVRVLILTGRNNHDWERSLPVLRATLEQAGRFHVEVTLCPPAYAEPAPAKPGKDATPEQQAAFGRAMTAWMAAGKAHEEAVRPQWDAWRPDFSRADVVVNHYNGGPWPAETRERFTAFVRAGGGVVNVHAANNAFKDWPEFNEMLGIGWRGAEGRRIVVDPTSGRAEELPPGAENGPGASAGHGRVHEFVVINRDLAHPVLNNLPESWRHGADELYHGQRGPANGLNILASAWSDPAANGSGRHEPVLWWVPFGKGRVVTTSLGHLWRGQEKLDAFTCAGFQTILARSAEWAATGKVTLPVPDGFPSAHRVSLTGPSGVRWKGAAASVTNAAGVTRFPALAPEESAARIELPPGYRVTVAAAEPLVQEPVWVTWDGNGAMYVAEMNSYMQDARGTGTKTNRNGRIKRLVDDDGNGRMDRATVFADHLLLPRMLLALDERLVVQETDDGGFTSLRDTDGDGVADERVRLWDGPRPKASVELQDSALTWNIDNWMYTAQGGQRHRFTRGKWETRRTQSEFNQWGLGMDDTGLLFFSQNSIPGRGFQQPWHAWELIGERMKWGRFERPGLGPETDAEFQKVFPLFPVGDRNEAMGRSWTSACGLSIYRGDALPEEMRGALLLAEPCGHLVRRARVRVSDDGTRLENLDPFSEFFLSRDFNTRPVCTATGPDGALYVVDMHRGIIQDSPWVGPEFVARIEAMGMDRVHNRGRILRITHDAVRPAPAPRLLDLAPAALVPHLAAANGWTRDLAQRLLVLRAERAVIPALAAMAERHERPLARLHALWTLEGLDALDGAPLTSALRDADPRVRAAAVRLHEPALARGDAAALAAVATAGDDADVLVRRQAVLSLGVSPTPAAVQAIQDIASRHATSAPVFLAAMTALHGREDLPLVARVRDGSLFRGIADVRARSAAQARWKAGLEAWQGRVAQPRGHDEADLRLVGAGAESYTAVCAVCHGADGRGVTPPGQPPLAPPLAGSPVVLGPKEALVRVLLHGLTGPVDGRAYAGGTMAPLGAGLTDEAVAGVLSYLRQEWTNDAAVILPAEVASIRRASAARTAPFTREELAAFAAPALTNRAAWAASSAWHTPANAVDGVVKGGHDHAWHGQNKPGCWIAVDLGETRTLTHLVLESVEPAYYPRGWEVRVSPDGRAWSDPVATGRGTGTRTVASFEPVAARHVKITQTGEAIDRWMISELHVHGR